MGRDDDWEDDEDRPRWRRDRDRYDDEDDDDTYADAQRLRRSRMRAKSGSVTGVGVVSIILGSLDLLFGLCLLLGVVFMGEAGRQGGGMGMPDFGGAIAIMVAVTLIVLLWGALAITSGIGVLNRRQWGRIMILILAGIGAAAGVLIIALGALAIGGNMQGAPDAAVLGFALYFAVAAVLIGYCIFAYTVLLSARNSVEFQ